MLLIENAIKYSNDASSLAPVVELEDHRSGTRISIKSYGVVIPLEDRERLFTKGFRSATHKTIEGTGMGLHNASELVKLFNGSLRYAAEKVNTVEDREVGWNCFHINIS
jgi:signal transduction histidine kinase